MHANMKLRELGSTGHIGVLCEFCLHRAVLSYTDLEHRHGIMRRIADVRFSCTKCGRRNYSLSIIRSQSEATRFMRRD
jgi:hypothetical protein